MRYATAILRAQRLVTGVSVMRQVKLPRVVRVRRPDVRSWYVPLVALLVAAVLIRVLLMAGYPTSMYAFNDSLRFLRFEGYSRTTGLFGDTWVPAGYSAFLIVAHAITSWLPFTMGLQHLLGLGTGVLIYLTGRRARAPRWLALVPAAIVLLNPDQLWLEHVIMSEALFTFFIAAGLYAAVRAAGSRASPQWLVASGVLMALSGLTRNVGLVLPLVVALWIALAVPGPWPRRARRAGLVAVPAVAVVAAYLLTASLSGGWAGLTDMGSWNLYGRVAQFADCQKFSPPAGTANLCESTPPATRPGPFFYIWNPQSHARQVTGQRIEPENSGPPGRFARAAILGQPVDYARTVAKDLFRFADPTVGTDRPDSGNEELDFHFVSSASAGNIKAHLDTRYSGVGQNLSLMGFFEAYQELFSLGGLGLMLLSVVSLAGLLFGRGPARMAALLFGVSAVVLYLGSVATWTYDVRYGVPPLGALALCAALGVLALARGRELGGDR